MSIHVSISIAIYIYIYVYIAQRYRQSTCRASLGDFGHTSCERKEHGRAFGMIIYIYMYIYIYIYIKRVDPRYIFSINTCINLFRVKG